MVSSLSEWNVKRILLAAPFMPFTMLDQKDTVWSAYGRLDFEMTQAFSVTVGLRYTSERKKGELMAGGVMQGGLKGAPLRFTLGGARYSRPGLLVAGEVWDDAKDKVEEHDDRERVERT